MMMSIERFSVGLEINVSYPKFRVSLMLLSTTQLKFQIKEGLFARTEVVDIHVVPLGNSLFAVRREKDGATVANVQDYDRGLIHSWAAFGGIAMFDPGQGARHRADPVIAGGLRQPGEIE